MNALRQDCLNSRLILHHAPVGAKRRTWQQRLEHLGVEFAIEDEASCCYALADKLWVTDPDGYRWELWLRTGEFDGMGEAQIGVNDPCDCRCSC